MQTQAHRKVIRSRYDKDISYVYAIILSYEPKSSNIDSRNTPWAVTWSKQM
jgi:hypothetical protein